MTERNSYQYTPEQDTPGNESIESLKQEIDDFGKVLLK